jgi:hypothetical protein
MTVIRVMDTVVRTAPLGVRFWDPATRRPITDGLVVSAWDRARPNRIIPLTPNASFGHVLHAAPGLSRSAWGDGTATFWTNPPEQAAFTIAVSDRLSRFLPMRLDAILPHQDWFVPNCLASPPPSPIELAAAHLHAPSGFVPLFAAAGRQAASNQGVILATLRDGDDATPAAWAVVVAEAHGSIAGIGVADGQGELTMLFPFPELERRPFTSGSPVELPPVSRQAGALPVLATDLTLRVFYAGTLAQDAAPDFCTLMTQPERRLVGSRSPAFDLGSVRLVLSRPLFPHSDGSPNLYVN